MAQGNLLVMPKRVVFEGNKKSEDLNLANTGKDTATYLISFIQYKMKEDGSFEKITDAEDAQFFADKNLRFFPRSVTLAPNEAQTVKVQIVKTSNLPDGEYRSHIYFRAVPKSEPLGQEAPPKNDSTLSISIKPVFGISLPVIIRKGISDAVVSISDAAVDYQKEKDKEVAVNFTFSRNGNMSVYGDISAEHISPQGAVTKVGMVKGVAVYTPGKTRNYHLVLDPKASVDLHSGKIKIVYKDQSAKPVTLASTEIALN